MLLGWIEEWIGAVKLESNNSGSGLPFGCSSIGEAMDRKKREAPTTRTRAVDLKEYLDVIKKTFIIYFNIFYIIYYGVRVGADHSLAE